MSSGGISGGRLLEEPLLELELLRGDTFFWPAREEGVAVLLFLEAALFAGLRSGRLKAEPGYRLCEGSLSLSV